MKSDIGSAYLRFLRLTDKLAILPPALSYPLLGRLGERISPLLFQREAFHAGLAAGGIAPAAWGPIWKRRLQDHAAASLNAFCHTRWNPDWVRRQVTLDLTELGELLFAGRGCLFLTYHHANMYSLFTVLGLSGCRVDVLAAPEESSPMYADLGHYIRLLHRGSARHFNGGNYLFFQNPRQAVTMTKAALSQGSLLVSLNDVPVPKTDRGKESYRLCGRRLPAASGSIRLARQLGVPVVAGALFRKGTRYCLKFRRLDEKQPYQGIVAGYFAYLEELLRDRPDFWDGWSWFADQSSSDDSGGTGK